MNITILIGRLTKGIEIRTTQNGTPVANFDLAVNRDKDNTDFIKCVAMGKSAEILADYTQKGSQIGIQGSIQTRNYEDKKGERRYVTEVFVNRVQLLDSKKKEEKEEYPKHRPQGTVLDTTHFADQHKESEDEFDDSTLPF